MNTELIVIIAAVFSSVLTWILTRKKSNAETGKLEIDTLDTAVKIWREMAAELKLSNIDLKKEVLELHKLVVELKFENLKLREQIQKIENKEKLKT